MASLDTYNTKQVTLPLKKQINPDSSNNSKPLPAPKKKT